MVWDRVNHSYSVKRTLFTDYLNDLSRGIIRHDVIPIELKKFLKITKRGEVKVWSVTNQHGNNHEIAGPGKCTAYCRSNVGVMRQNHTKESG